MRFLLMSIWNKTHTTFVLGIRAGRTAAYAAARAPFAPVPAAKVAVGTTLTTLCHLKPTQVGEGWGRMRFLIGVKLNLDTHTHTHARLVSFGAEIFWRACSAFARGAQPRTRSLEHLLPPFERQK